ncbi:purine and uridine phosphorylase [Penicillium cataractarum]|uniref:Purine and uridine phosphorylase n=1 Tax=Penicillium cataractarum TaxID=2100454 RepID=A0A9W9UXU7_9EURO|nr:purine and uridine phosphorylase [Penicillium cataractarum]KAJ5359140.1 purine and uridine phosphorylase [Penicillium cataractarum]
MSMLDETHLPLPQSQADSNTYVLGRIHTHDVVLACLPEMGLAPAATVARQMKQSFPDLRCALLVGIGGGIPSEGYDIRLGDVVVGVPGSKYGSVVQWDYGKTVAEGKFVHYGVLNDPPAVLLTAVNALRARYNMGQTGIVENLEFGSSRIPSDMNAREENIFYQDYWHESRILERGNDARSSQFAIRQDERQLLERLLSQPPGQGPNFEMEPKLAEFMHEYRSELLEQLADFPNPQQQRGLFAAMLRMTKGSLDHDSDTCRTLLHWLAMNGVSDVLPKLIDIGFDVNHKDSDWQTPLHLAVIENHFPTVAVLVQQCHADVHAKDLNGLLAWHHALHIDWDNCADNDEREKSRISIIRLLAAFTNIESIKGAKARKSLSRLKTDPEAVILL